MFCGQRFTERDAMLDREWAERFAADWIAAGNAHDLEATLIPYADGVVSHSPRIALVLGGSADLVAGKPALARYWTRALAQASALHFTADRLYVGSDSMTLTYRNHRHQNAAETFVFDRAGLVR